LEDKMIMFSRSRSQRWRSCVYKCCDKS